MVATSLLFQTRATHLNTWLVVKWSVDSGQAHMLSFSHLLHMFPNHIGTNMFYMLYRLPNACEKIFDYKVSTSKTARFESEHTQNIQIRVTQLIRMQHACIQASRDWHRCRWVYTAPPVAQHLSAALKPSMSLVTPRHLVTETVATCSGAQEPESCDD